MRTVLSVVLGAFMLLGFAQFASAANVDLGWNPNTEPNLSGYRLYIGTRSGSYKSIVTVGKTTSINLSDLLPNKRYYFVLTAFNSNGRESARSKEVSAVASSPNSETDSDEDGISDDRERELGTDPFERDTDGDGSADGQEIIDGTDPLDQGSVKLALGKQVCAEWNGFFENFWNILEVSNSGSRAISVGVSLYDKDGSGVSRSNVTIAAKAQVDVLVHDLRGYRSHAYGLVCLDHDGNTGDLDGRMVYYKGQPTPTTSQQDFQFAFAMPFSPGKLGRQVVPFNTYNPSFNSEDAENPVANWIQLTNLSDRRVVGEMVYYDVEGNRLGMQSVSIGAMQRTDMSAHQFGPNRVGMVVWNPRDPNLRVQMRNVRYVYDNPDFVESFDGAFELEALQGSNHELFSPFNTKSEISVVEVFNSSSHPSRVGVTYYSASRQIKNITFIISGFASRHIVLNQLLGENISGVVKVQSLAGGSVGSVVMQYGARSDGKLDYMYGIAAGPAIGSVNRGSYNTFLGQDSELLVINTTSSSKTASITIEGTSGLRSRQVVQQQVGKNTLEAVRLNDYEAENRYGTVEVSGGGNNSFLSWVIRRRGSQYVIPTPVR